MPPKVAKNLSLIHSFPNNGLFEGDMCAQKLGNWCNYRLKAVVLDHWFGKSSPATRKRAFFGRKRDFSGTVLPRPLSLNSDKAVCGTAGALVPISAKAVSKSG